MLGLHSRGGLAALGIALLLAIGSAAVAPSAALAHKVDDVSAEEVAKPGPLPEISIGQPEAPVTIVEYASMTCSHCGKFHREVLPLLRRDYIDKGLVRLLIREFPIDNLSAAAFMLVRCVGPMRSYGLLSTLFEKQDAWVVRDNPVAKLFALARDSGFTQETFNRCLSDQSLLEQISAVSVRATQAFNVKSTPTFFINGRGLEGGSIEAFRGIIDPMIANAKR